MVTYDKRLDFFITIHSLAHLNFSAVLGETSQAEFFVMMAVNKTEQLNSSSCCGISGIADTLHVSSPAVSRTITTLEKKGWVERRLDKFNRRSTVVRLTENGCAVFDGECRRIYNFMNNVVKRMGEDKLNELLALSGELIDNVQKEIKKFDESL